MHFRETNKYANRRSKLPIYIAIRNTCMEHFKNKTTNPTNTSIKKCVKVGEKNATLELKNTQDLQALVPCKTVTLAFQT